MDFRAKNGSIFHVTNEALIPDYENNPEFELVTAKEEAKEPKKKTTTTKK